MNGDDIKWLEKIFGQHKAEQQLYLDTKFKNLEEKIREVKEIASTTGASLVESEKQCLACRACLHNEIEEAKKETRKNTNKKLVITGVVSVIAALTLWTAYGAEIVKFLLGKLF